ncbi:MAG: hypothetical protein IJ343_15485 [Clostridia bacterium]|nr:hypothetical protein [Clostridia bacterium]
MKQKKRIYEFLSPRLAATTLVLLVACIIPAVVLSRRVTSREDLLPVFLTGCLCGLTGYFALLTANHRLVMDEKGVTYHHEFHSIHMDWTEVRSAFLFDKELLCIADVPSREAYSAVFGKVEKPDFRLIRVRSTQERLDYVLAHWHSDAADTEE